MRLLIKALKDDALVRTTAGHMCRLEKEGDTFEVEGRLAQAAISSMEVTVVRTLDDTPLPPTHLERDPVEIQDAIKELIARNDKAAFTTAGYPRVTSVEAIIGYEIKSADVKKAWDVVMDENKSDEDTATLKAAEASAAADEAAAAEATTEK